MKHIVTLTEKRYPGMHTWKDMISLGKNQQDLAAREQEITPHCNTNIQFTSGTTGYPKGATLTHHGVVNNGLQVGQRMVLTSDDKICIPVPLYHCFGCVLGNMVALTHGATMVYPAESFDPKATILAVSKE